MTDHAALTHRHMLTLPTITASVAMARRTAEYVYGSWGVNPGHLGPALIILSELVTNCVRHAAETAAGLDVIYAADGGVLAFAVHDRHPHQPDLLKPAKPDGGLAMVAELIAELCGTATLRPDADGGGKTIWITLPLQ